MTATRLSGFVQVRLDLPLIKVRTSVDRPPCRYTLHATELLLSRVRHQRGVRIMKRVRRLALLTAAAVVAVGATAAMTASASAAAVVTRGSVTTIEVPEPIQSDNCGTGMISGTDTFTYTSVQTPTGGSHIAGSDVANGRIDWSDGSYSLLGSTDHSAFNVAAGTVVYTEAHVDFADNYSADGVLESQGTFRSTEHITVTNGVVVRVAFDYPHIRGTFC